MEVLREGEMFGERVCFQSAVHARPAWEGYVLEGLVVAGMVLYLSNYLIGRSKNGALAYTWWVLASLVPRPFPSPVFDRILYAKMEGEGLGERVTCVTSGRREGRH